MPCCFSALPTLLLLLLVAMTAQGIRLDRESLTNLQLQKKSLQVVDTRRSSGEGTGSTTIACRETAGSCSGRSRKLVAYALPAKRVSPTTAPTITSQHDTLAPEKYPDLMDLTGMDYSAARKKPSIHN